MTGDQDNKPSQTSPSGHTPNLFEQAAASAAEPRVETAAPAPTAAPVISAAVANELPAAPAAASPAKDPRKLTKWPSPESVVTDPAEGARRALIVGRVIVGVVTLGLAGLVGRVAQLQFAPQSEIAALKDTQRSEEKIVPRRGTIFDRQGRMLTGSRTADLAFVDPQMAEDMATFPERIGAHFGYDPARIAKKIHERSDKRYIVIDRKMSEERVDKVDGFKLDGFGIEQRVVREYPQGKLLGQVLGFVGNDGHGIEGVEKMFDRELSGTPGKMGYLRDAQRRSLFVEEQGYQPPVDGRPVKLSVDMIIQSIAEKELEDACKTFSAEGGEMLVMDPNTGEVLAMANYPTVDLNQYGTTKPVARQNRCVTWTYEPGSTFKPYIWAWALQKGVFTRNEMYDCTTSGVYAFASGRRLRDAHPVGFVNADTVLTKSSNIGMGKIGTELGQQESYKAMTSFGFGSRSGSGLPGEIGGKVWPLKLWSKYTITSVSMGQEVAVTPLQMARAFSAFANGGRLPTPTIRAIDSKSPPVLDRVLKPEIADATREVLRGVVTDGTGKKADSPLYAIFGKTGTAQIAGKKGGYIPDAFVASFICGAPVENPRLVVLCAIHHPDRKKGHFGGTVAAPAARRVVEQSLIYLGVPAQPQEEAPVKGRVASR